MTKGVTPKTNKRSLILQVNRATGLPQSACSAVLEQLLKQVVASVAAGHCVTLRGLATFYTKERVARGGVRNPKTGAPASLPRRRVMLARVKV